MCQSVVIQSVVHNNLMNALHGVCVLLLDDDWHLYNGNTDPSKKSWNERKKIDNVFIFVTTWEWIGDFWNKIN